MQEFSDIPRFGRIRAAEARSGLRRGFLYKLAAKHPGLFKKAGAATLVDLPCSTPCCRRCPQPTSASSSSTATPEKGIQVRGHPGWSAANGHCRHKERARLEEPSPSHSEVPSHV
jgi:hypothetical protein